MRDALIPKKTDARSAEREAPECIPLPNGELRVTVPEYQRWLNSRKKAA